MNLSDETHNAAQPDVVNTTSQTQETLQCNREHPHGHVYAIGYVKPYFATIDLEKQCEAAAEFTKQSTTSFDQIFNYVTSPNEQPNLRIRPFLYLAQQATWVFTINNVDTYTLYPRTLTQLNALIQASTKNEVILVGLVERISVAGSHGSEALPSVLVEHLIDTVDGTKSPPKKTREGALAQLKPNIGRSNLERASNYLVTHFDQINTSQTQNEIIDNVNAVHFQHVSLYGDRSIIEVILSNPNDTRFACNIDVTNAYPFVSSKLAPFAKSS
ncbi:hypothetical protein [Pseudoalteromonas sp. MMG005]|uniref:hypothetical protein n=1 Tax=Pseudoalteromonas sp. MMG005 TaxID=2822682 RepID=UPI001B3A3F52|nr:hypothetical protein [Pseudoalteromonas sp. MMG005]MBQ4845119.1 hypothetical protein [Pseudoalteromonas sp. MMG005]